MGNNSAAILVKAKLSRIDDFVKETDYDKLKKIKNLLLIIRNM